MYSGNFTGDPLTDFENWDAEQERLLARYPKCDMCGERVTDKLYTIKGKIYCPDCLEWFFAEDADEWVEANG